MYVAPNLVRLIEAVSRMVVARGWQEGEMLVKGYKLSVTQDK